MRIRKGKRTYKLPAIGMLLDVFVRTRKGDPAHVLQRISYEDMEEWWRKKRTGRPTYCAVSHGYAGEEIHLYPVPDASAELTVRYFPPSKEI